MIFQREVSVISFHILKPEEGTIYAHTNIHPPIPAYQLSSHLLVHSPGAITAEVGPDKS